MGFKDTISKFIKDEATKTLIMPFQNRLEVNLASVSTAVGDFVITAINNKIARSITFVVTNSYYDSWMEEALYGILYTYNNIKKNSNKLELTNKKGDDGTSMYYKLPDGAHKLKYRNYDIFVSISTESGTNPMGGRTNNSRRSYVITTFSLDNEFVKYFEADMISNRDSLLRINSNSAVVNIYQDSHDNDGYTYWDKASSIPKRKLNTVYLDYETKSKIVNTVNRFFADREYYIKHGIPHNLKILLYGPPAGGKDTIAKMIASEWHRNIYFVTGGKGGRFVPNAITSSNVRNPLFLVSDIDKYHFLVNEVAATPEGSSDPHAEENRLAFGSMINALDGVMSGDGRITVMTTNHIEKFSDTFMRPGRVDLKLEIKHVGVEVFRKYIYDFYKKALPETIELKSNNISIADLQADVIYLHLTFDEIVKKYVK